MWQAHSKQPKGGGGGGGVEFAPLINLRDDDTDIDSMITTYNIAVADAASKILGKECPTKKPWVTRDVPDLCGGRRDFKIQKSQQKGSEGLEESDRRLDRYQVQGD